MPLCMASLADQVGMGTAHGPLLDPLCQFQLPRRDLNLEERTAALPLPGRHSVQCQLLS